MSVGGSAAGGAVGGLVVDRPGGVPWGFVLAGVIGLLVALVAVWPSGPLSRADRLAAARLQGARAVRAALTTAPATSPNQSAQSPSPNQSPEVSPSPKVSPSWGRA
jgi:hypothetical protein